ncbi:MAG: methyltransferase domain-containing protein [Pseudomonadota bacterium]
MVPCPGCGAANPIAGYRIAAAPVHAVRLCESAEAARVEATAPITLAFCGRCGLVFNAGFDAGKLSYDDAYEGTQSFSPTFRRFSATLAAEVAEAARGRPGPVVEAGCGQGEFLREVLAAGAPAALGFDMAHDPARAGPFDARLRIEAAPFAPGAVGEASALISKMTLEHVAAPGAFLAGLAEAAGRARCPLFLTVPDAGGILARGAFPDVLYEHANYFTAASLGQLLARAGFREIAVRPGFGAQYLVARARPGAADPPPVSEEERETFSTFAAAATASAGRWRDWRRALGAEGRRLLLWPGASKAVGFLAATGPAPDPVAAVDINPRKAGTFLPGSGLPILAPATAAALAPTDILLMNPIYAEEVATQAAAAGLSARITPFLTEGP